MLPTNTTDSKITLGNVSVGGSVYEPWPQTWNTPATNAWSYWTVLPSPAEEYANEVEVTRGEHDATIRFYRKRANSRALVKEITVPLGVLAWLQGGDA